MEDPVGAGAAAGERGSAAVTGGPTATAAPESAGARRPDGRGAVPESAGARRPDERGAVPEESAEAADPAPRSADVPREPDRPCPRCGVANAAERHLCGSCGALLDPVAPATGSQGAARSRDPAARPSWWRRTADRFARRHDRVVKAGYRPQPRAMRRPRVVWPVVALVLAGAGWFARSQLTGLADLARDHATKPAPLHPDSTGASSHEPGHPATMAFDGFSNRYWAPAAPGKGVGQYLEAGFHHSVRLQTILITSGCSVDDGKFLTQARPARITLTFFTADGHATRRTISLDDTAGAQSFTVHASGTTRVRLTTDASYGAGRGRRLAVTEVEFFGRR